MIEKYPPIVQVDNNGKIIGPINYEIAHAKHGQERGIRNLTAQICVFKSDEYNELLISKRGNIDRPGKLNLGVGGHAIWIESKNRAQNPLENAISEISEEIFYNICFPKNFELNKVTEFRKDLRLKDLEYVHLFSCVYPGPFSINPEEVSEVFFMEINKLKNDLNRNPEKYTKSAELYLEKLLENLHLP